MWRALEPYHAVTYFTEESRQAFNDVGLRGFWMGYFAGRAAPMGPVGPGVVVATFFGFRHSMVARALPDAWTFASASDVLAARLAGVDAALRRLLGDAVGNSAVAEAAGLGRAAAEAADPAGRPIFAANADLPWPAEPHLVLWQAATLLREHRGDGHVVALTGAGLDGCESHVSMVAAGVLSREVLQPNRGWTGDDVGPLHGVPVTIKDCFATEGIVTTVGTTGLRSFVPDADDVTVARLRQAGAVVVGKTNCPELLMGLESDNLVYGRTVNPYDVGRTCGGSSGGEAAIVAAGASPLGLGSDSGGSLRVPAHFCGVATLKPTHGRVPITSAVFPSTGPFSRLRAIGTLAPTVADLGLALAVLAGPDGRDPWAAPVALRDPEDVDVSGLRVAVYTDDGVRAA